MKRLISIFLSLVMIFLSLAAPMGGIAFAKEGERDQIKRIKDA